MKKIDSFGYCDFGQNYFFNKSEIQDIEQSKPSEFSLAKLENNRNTANDIQLSPDQINPLGSLVTKTGYKFCQIQKSKQKRIIIVHDSSINTNQNFYRRVNCMQDDEQPYNLHQKKHDITKLLCSTGFYQTNNQKNRSKNESTKQKNNKLLSIRGEGHFSMHEKKNLQEDFQKIVHSDQNQIDENDKEEQQYQTIIDDFLPRSKSPPKFLNKRENPSNSLQQKSIQRAPKERETSEKSKVLLNNILIGMQSKFTDIKTEKHMRIFGLQIKALKLEQDNLKTQKFKKPKSMLEDKNQFLQAQMEEKQKKIQKWASEFKSERRTIGQRKKSIGDQTMQQRKSSVLQKPNSKGTNFRFAISDYPSMSREQLFQYKLNSYHEYVYCCGLQSGIYVVPNNEIKEIKFRVSRGNNSLLVKELLKNRWWLQIAEQSDSERSLNILWSQIRSQSFHQMQTPNRINIQDKMSSKKLVNNEDRPQSISQCRFQGRNNERYGIYFDPFHKIVSPEEIEKIKNIQQEDRLKVAQYLKYVTIFDKPTNFRMHNHLEMNYHLGNKKALFQNLREYYSLLDKNVFEYIPLTFHIQSGTHDTEYQKFLQAWKTKQNEIENQEDKKNIWIVKPGELTNRGNGIRVCDNIKEINQIIQKKCNHPNGKPLTYIVQQYIDRPLLYNKRKFDIRCFMLITHINGTMRAYWYEEGYLRTSSSEFNLKDCTNSYIHLTNDAIQKYSDDYGKYENGNKLSFLELQRYLELWYPTEKFEFFKDIYPKLKHIATLAVKSVFTKIDVNKLEHNFEVFGLDFMIDEKFHPWLIEINTNPCLELSSPLLARLIPQMLENAFRLSIDVLYPPPQASVWHGSKKHQLFYDNFIESNRFQVIFDQRLEGFILKQLFNKSNNNEMEIFDETDEEYASEEEQQQK